jgi:fructose-bisphosphate aldolase class I
MKNLTKIATSLVAAGKGILAADESPGTIAKRFKNVGVECTEESRRAYRELLFTAPDLGHYISGVILYDETLRQKSADGTPFPELLKQLNIVPGIKVDAGAKALALHPGEKITEGLDGLRDRLAEYAKLGARFSKWRAVLAIGDAIPSPFCLEANVHALARFAALSQEAGLVPIVEPEVLMDGPHSIERCEEVAASALTKVFRALGEHGVQFEGMLLKPNMIVSGTECLTQAGTNEVAEATLRCLKRFVPAAVPGIVFLSGGQSDVEATQNLNAMNQLGGAPWELSFSFGRALQAPVLAAWAGKAENGPAAQRALVHRALCNHEARSGRCHE